VQGRPGAPGGAAAGRATRLTGPIMQTALPAPPIVAVVVVCDAGEWLEETLAAVGEQDYPNLSVLVVDAGSSEDPTARIAALLPGAHVRRVGRGRGFGQAANEVIGAVEGAAYYLFCHDDAAPRPDAARRLVEEALRSNAGVVSPKLVAWEDPRRLLALGSGADRVGVVHPLVERGELDQGQHDGPRDVFAAAPGALLVRADLFEVLGGFDLIAAGGGEELDLSWRAHVAGARVVVAPDAAVRHLEAGPRRPQVPRRSVGRHAGAAEDHSSAESGEARRARLEEQRLHSLLVCSSIAELVWLVPLALLYLAGEAATTVLSGRPGEGLGQLLGAGRALAHPGRVRRARQRLAPQRRADRRELRRLQTRGNVRLRQWVRARADAARAVPFAVPARAVLLGAAPAAGSQPPGSQPSGSQPSGSQPSLPTGADPPGHLAGALAASGDPPARRPVRAGPSWQVPVAVGCAAAVLLLLGSRDLLGHDLPGIGDIPVTSGGVGEWWRSWWSTWQPAGLGRIGPSPPALLALCVAGVVTLGAYGTLQHLLVLGPLAVGPIGAYRLAAPWGGRRGRIVGLVAYAATPVAYDALGRGDWSALVVYAAAPWVLAALARLSGSLPHPQVAWRRAWGRTVGLGLLVALVAAVSPSFLVVVAVIAAALGLGSLVAAQRAPAGRLLVVGLGAAVVAAVLLLPWSAVVLTRSSALFAPRQPGVSSFATLLRLGGGSVGSAVLGWGLLLAAVLPLVIGRSWRLAWAARLWTVTLVAVFWAWAGSHGWVPAPSSGELLAVAGAAVAGCVALGAVAFEQDLPGYRFGWRQAASGVAAAGLVLGALPVLGTVPGGRWGLPAEGPRAELSALAGAPGGAYRILWVGLPGSLPLASSPAGGGLSWAMSFDALPDVTDQWPSVAPSGASALVRDLRFASSGLTSDLGHLLAPLGVRYVVLPVPQGRLGGGSVASALRPLEAGLTRQVDLVPLDVGPGSGYAVWSNASWLPVRTVVAVASSAAAWPAGPAGLAGLDLGDPPTALGGGRVGTASGSLGGGEGLYVAAGDRTRWRLDVSGDTLRATPALGVGMLFSVPVGRGGRAVLSLIPSLAVRAGQVAEVVIWLLAIAAVVLDQRRRRSGAPEAVEAEWFAPLRSPARRRRVSTVSLAPAPAGEEDRWDG